jgi:hypothetical protein
MGGTDPLEPKGMFPGMETTGSAMPALRVPGDHVPWATTLTEDKAPKGDDERAIAAQVANLRAYSALSARDARVDRALIWAFKLPIIIGSTIAATLAGLGDTTAAVILSSISAVCAAVDALRPRGLLYGVHRRASNEAARVAANIQSEWQAAKLEVDDPDARRTRAAELVRKCIAAREKIDEYVTGAEASVGGGSAGARAANEP